MNSAELRTMVHEVLLEELASFRKSNSVSDTASEQVAAVANTSTPTQVSNQACWVPMRTESDLAMFARRVLQLAEDPDKRQAIEDGKFPFRFEQSPGGNPGKGVNPATSSAAQESRIDKGLVNEKYINRLPPGTTILNLGKSATITPLARDKARRSGISIIKVNQ